MTVEDVADRLRVGLRMAYRYAEQGKIKTERLGRRVVFNRLDVERLAGELQVEKKPRPKPQGTAMAMPDAYVRHIRDLEAEVKAAAMEIGRLRGILEQRLLPDEEHDLRKRIIEAEQRSAIAEQRHSDLQAELERARRPWWKRIFGD